MTVVPSDCCRNPGAKSCPCRGIEKTAPSYTVMELKQQLAEERATIARMHAALRAHKKDNDNLRRKITGARSFLV